MYRRNVLTGAVAAVSGLFAAKAAQAAPVTPDKAKVVYHLCDLEKVNFVLGNIQNHFDGMGGPDKVTIALVIHGPALKSFHSASANPDLKAKVAGFSRARVELAACGNTMRGQGVTLSDLLPGFVAADRGGVVRIAELQSQGYVYLKP
jgi:intracellular sulfur oxidation DsrE/DsrF family protein